MTASAADRPAIDVRGLGYTFAGRTAPSLQEISFDLPPDSWTLVTGHTGSGKSTLLRALCGLIPHQAAGEMRGTVELFGTETRAMPTFALAQTAGLVLQSPDDQICTSTVESEVAFGLQNLCLPVPEIDARIALWLDRLGLSGCRRQSTETLSGGQKQRLMLASILAMGPRILLLDEPLAQLDYAGALELLALLDSLRRDGLTIVVCEHRLEELLSVVDHVLVLERGRLVADDHPSGPGLGQSQAVSPVRARAPADRAEALPPVATVTRLAHRFASQALPVWEDVQFAVAAGEIVSVVGANGSGKSTLLGVLAGSVRPTAGEIHLAVGGTDTLPVGLVAQNPDLMLFSRTVREELGFGPRQLGLTEPTVSDRVAAAATALSIAELLEEPPLALSQGQRLRVAVAAVVTLHPRLLLLDEPTTGQDSAEVERLLTAITSMVGDGQIGAVLFSTHDLRLVSRFAHRALVLAGGRLAADCSPHELAKNDELLGAARLRATGNGGQQRTDNEASVISLAGSDR